MQGTKGPVVCGRVRDSEEVNYGFNAETEEFEDLVGSGVIDPTMVDANGP